MAFNMDDYVDVPERLRQALERWTELRIQCGEPKVVTIADRSFIEVTVRAWRTPDDQIPAQATAWEPFPGQTPYTKNSEMMNAETSALGRCLAVMGIGTRRSMASANEVKNRQAERSHSEHPANPRPRPQSAPAPFEDDYVPPGEPAPVIPMKKVAAGAKAKPATNLTLATAPQVSTIKNLLEQTQMGLLDATHAALGQEQATVENLSKGDASTLIKYLIEQKEGQ